MDKFSNPICKDCKRCHLGKYQGFVDEEKREYKDFSVRCAGIPEKYLSDKLVALLSPEEAQEALGIYDPVEWAKANIKNPDGTPWTARWYQEAMLRCTAARKVSRCGRRIGKTAVIAVDVLHYVMTHANKKVLVVTPYKAQALEIVTRMRNFIRSSPALSASLVRDKESPFFYMEFGNGCTISCFSSGVKSGAEAGQVRGQDADKIYLDEADYLNDGDLKSLLAILATHHTTELWASSTPTGRRSQFWRWCTTSPTYKEFHFPTMVSPEWAQMEEELKSDYIGRKDDWLHEILSEFGSESVGVFQHQFVDAAKRTYNYTDEGPQPGWTYCMGVDWNSAVGTEIFVTGYCAGKYKAVDALNVPKQGWTQLAGMNAILEMNAKWSPAFIYADEGYGSTQIELLQKYGFDMGGRDKGDPACRLPEILKSYNFSKKIEVYDPLTKQPIGKHAKPFLIENVARRFEEGTIEISQFDQVLIQQLANYIIKYRTEAGAPVYGQLDERIGDHRVDAFALSLIAFKIEMSDFGLPNYAVGIAITSSGPGNSQPQLTKKEREEKKLARMPQSRYDMDKPSFVNHDMPGRLDEQIGTDRQGWNTDEEDKYATIWRQKQLQKRARYIRERPRRSNF